MLKDAKWLAERLGLAGSTVKSKGWRDRVNVPHTKIGGVIRFEDYLIDEWLKCGGNGGKRGYKLIESPGDEV